jgi:hypothetical protein
MKRTRFTDERIIGILADLGETRNAVPLKASM